MASSSGLEDTAADGATSLIEVRPCMGITIACTAGTLNVKIKNSNNDIHADEEDGWNIAENGEKSFTALESNAITGFVPSGVGASATYSYTIDIVG